MHDLSGVLVPIVAMLIPIVAIIAGAWQQGQKHRIRAEQQMALIARGVPPAEIDAYLKSGGPVDGDGNVKDPMRSLANARRTATVLISIGCGLMVFFLIFGSVMLAHVDKDAGWALIACAAAGLIPLAIGVGFWFDYRLQMREMARFGLEVGTERR